MKIVEITAVNFGNIGITVPVKFDTGLNVWVSKNQAGKTTLLTFLEWMLYGPQSKRGVKALESVQRWTPWKGVDPGGSVTIAPELKNWPKLIRVIADFAKYEVQVLDAGTGRNLSEHVTVDKAGEWNLGQLLLNLSRESFRYSLAVLQNNLLDPLRQGSLRQILTSDMGSLVENPNLSFIDRVLEDLNSPQFSLAGSMPAPLADHRRALEKELDFLNLEQDRLDQHLGEFRELLLSRDALKAQFEEQQRVIYGLDRQTEQLELARNYYMLKGPGKSTTAAAEPAPTGVDVHISPELEREASKFAAQLEVIEQQLEHERLSLQALEDHAAGKSVKQPAASIPPALTASVESTKQELDQAAQRVEEISQSIPDTERKRFDELRKLFDPQREQLSTLMNWQREHMQANEELARLRERRVELEYLSRIQLPKRFYVGLGLILPAVYFTFAASYMGMFGFIGWIVAIVCWILAAVFCSSFWRARQKAGPHVHELRTEILPAMEACREQMQALDRRRRRFIDMYKVGRLDFDKLVENILEYTQLDMQLREYNGAVRDRDTLERRLHSTWARLCEVVPMAPPSLDLAWFQSQLDQGAGAGTPSEAAAERKVRLAERQEDVARLQAERKQLLKQLQLKLDEAGLEISSGANLQAVLDQLRQLASQSTQGYQAESLAEAAGTHVLGEEEFNFRWEQLPRATQQQLTQLVSSPAGMKSVADRLHQTTNARKTAELEREHLRQQLDELREQLARFGLLDETAAELDGRVRQAKERHTLVVRWEQAVASTRQMLDSLVARAGQDVAPEINKELVNILQAAPITGLKGASLGPALELRLELDGMPSGVPVEDRWQYMSAGAQAQLALVIRLALAQTASGRTGLPLLLDEPFAELDDERAALLFGYIARLTKASQIILTTCHGLLAKWLLEQYQQAYPLDLGS